MTETKGDKLTCLSCGANGIGVGFKHDCDPIAARRERAAVVAWLRSDGGDTSRWGSRLDALADAIESGERLKTEDDFLRERRRLQRDLTYGYSRVFRNDTEFSAQASSLMGSAQEAMTGARIEALALAGLAFVDAYVGLGTTTHVAEVQGPDLSPLTLCGLKTRAEQRPCLECRRCQRIVLSRIGVWVFGETRR